MDVGQLRRKVNLSQEEMARLLGTSWVTVSRWERKRAVPRSEARALLHRLQRLEIAHDPRIEVGFFAQIEFNTHFSFIDIVNTVP